MIRVVAWLGFASMVCGFALLQACSEPKTLVKFKFVGTPLGTVVKMTLDVDIAGNKTTYEVTDPQPITFPREYQFEVKAGVQGLLTLKGALFDEAGLTVALLTGSGVVMYQKTLEIEVQVGPVIDLDAGMVDLAGPSLGTAKLLVAGPAMKDFGGVNVNTNGQTWTVYIINEGPDPTGELTFMGSKLAPAPTDGGMMADLGGYPFLLRNDGCTGKKLMKSIGCSFDVQFAPRAVATFTDTIAVMATPGGMLNLSVSGMGTMP